jgi:cytochrome c peroxidase
MEESVKELGVILPLDKEGKVTCPTCHNPHEKGVLPDEEASAQGASEKYRLRLAAQNLQICIACHKDKFKDMQLE